jgi:hypothetical protein
MSTVSVTKFMEAGQIQGISISIDTRNVNQWVVYALDSLIPSTPLNNADIYYTITLYTIFSALRERLCLGIYPASRYGIFNLGCIGNGAKFTIFAICQESALVVRELLKVASGISVYYSLYSSLCKRIGVVPSRENFDASIVDISPRYSTIDVAVVYSRSQSQLQNVITEMIASYQTDIVTPTIPKPVSEPPYTQSKSPFIKLHTPGGLNGLVLVLYTEYMFPEPVIYHGGFMWLRKKQFKRIATYTDEKSATESLQKVFKGGDEAGHTALIYIGVTRGVLAGSDVKGAVVGKLSDYVAMIIKHVAAYRPAAKSTTSVQNVILSSVSRRGK